MVGSKNKIGVVMGYLDGLTNSWFKKRDDGNVTFYPYGKFGNGYILSRESELKIKKFLTECYTIFFPVAILCAVLFRIFAFVFLLFFIPYYSIKIRQLVSNSEKTQEKMRFNEPLENMAKSMGAGISIFILVGSFVMTSLAVFFIFQPGSRLVGILCALFFGLCLLQSIFMVKYSIKFKKEDN